MTGTWAAAGSWDCSVAPARLRPGVAGAEAFADAGLVAAARETRKAGVLPAWAGSADHLHQVLVLRRGLAQAQRSAAVASASGADAAVSAARRLRPAAVPHYLGSPVAGAAQVAALVVPGHQEVPACRLAGSCNFAAVDKLHDSPFAAVVAAVVAAAGAATAAAALLAAL